MYAYRTTSDIIGHTNWHRALMTADHGIKAASSHYAASSFDERQIAEPQTGSSFDDVEVARGGDNVHSLDAARDRARAKVHLRMLRRLPFNHDGEGASAPIASSVDAALAFIGRISSGLWFSPTLGDDGLAVIEFEDREKGLFADITFLEDKATVECYVRRKGQESRLVTGLLAGSEVTALLIEAGVIA